MNNQTKAKLEAGLITVYITVTSLLGIVVFGRFILALLIN